MQGQQGAGAPPAGAPPAPQAAAGDSKKTTKVKFKIPWSSDRGYFAAGRVKELPANIAASLIKEKVAVETDEDETPDGDK